MRTIGQAVLQKQAVGRRLMLPWRAMNDRITLRTGELVVMAGAPGGGKSTLAVNMAMKMEYPVLYFAQDTPASVLSRMAALAINQETNSTFEAINSEQRIIISKQLEDTRPSLVFERGAQTLEEIEERIEALTEWLGEAPSVVFIDNLMDLIVPGNTPGDNSFYHTALPAMKRMANRHNTSFIVLHHVTRGGGAAHGQGRTGISMTNLLFAGEREARHVWGVYNDGGAKLTVQVLKQQDGPADPAGALSLALAWHPKLGSLLSVATQELQYGTS